MCQDSTYNTCINLTSLRRLRDNARKTEWGKTTHAKPLRRNDYRLRLICGDKPEPLPVGKSVEEVQAELPHIIRDYLESECSGPILIRLAPGIGKTYSMSKLVQEMVTLDKGKTRIIWASERKNSFDDIKGFPHFDSNLWYQWLSLLDNIPGTRKNICRFRDQQNEWSKAGHPVRVFCEKMCARDGHMPKCHFISQAGRSEPIIHVRHQHLSFGIPMGHFDFAVVDEMPLGAFMNDRIIPGDRLLLTPSPSPHIDNLAKIIQMVTMECKTRSETMPGGRSTRVSGFALFNIIGDYVNAILDLQGELEENRRFLPIKVLPDLNSTHEVSEIHHNWLPDFLRLAAVELGYFESAKSNAQLSGSAPRNQKQWAERIWVDADGLHLIYKHQIWSDLPEKVVLLDATGDESIYQRIFGKPIQVYSPSVIRKGKVFQICQRTNGKSMMLGDDGELTEHALDNIRIIKRLTQEHGYAKLGVVCHKAVEQVFGWILGSENVMHFGGLRGSNKLQGCDALFICGTPGGNSEQVVKIALALNPDRREPYGTRDRNGHIQPVWEQIPMPYRLTEEGLRRLQQEYGVNVVGAKRLNGHYIDPELDLISRQLRQAELVQTIHRARITRRNVDVWLLSAVVTDEPVDWVMQTPPIGPSGIPWSKWLRIEDWLNGQYERGNRITYVDLAEVTGTSEAWIRREDWLRKIVEYQPQKWQLVLSSGGRGNKKLAVPIGKI